MRSFRDILGQRLLIEQLMRPVKTGRIVHAQIFAGPSGVGKRSAAELIARALNCAHDDIERKPCGECASCRQFLSGNSPNLITLAPENNLIRVDAARALIRKLSLKPAQGGVVCVIIEDADHMNENAQNALLKTLEDTPEYAAFFLICEKPEALLPTIRSRSTLVRFAPLSYEECARLLVSKGVPERRALEVSAEAGGSPGQALSIVDDESYANLRARAIEALTCVKSAIDVTRAFSIIKNDKDEAARILRIYEHVARQLMYFQAHAAEPPSGEIETLNINGVRGEKLMRGVIEASRRFKANCAYKTIMRMLFLGILAQEGLSVWQQ